VSNGSPVPATAYSAWSSSQTLSQVVIGTSNYSPTIGDFSTAAIWLLVIDLTDLSVVANELSTDGSTVPSDVAQYVGNPRYLLYAIGNNAWASVLPQGDLYALLQKVGAGQGLANLEQIFAQIGTGFLNPFTYILAATMDASDAPGFEVMSVTNIQLLTMAFLPITVDGNTSYVPIQSGSS
jgi:hypothetical protein